MKKTRLLLIVSTLASILVLATIALAAAIPEENPPPSDRPDIDNQSTAAPSHEHPEGIFYFWNFEDDNGGFNGTLDWEWGTYAWAGSTCDSSNFPPPAAHSGSHMWGTVLNSCYQNRGNNTGFDTCVNGNPADDSILSFTVDLTGVTGAIELSWWEWFDLFMDWDWAEVYVNGNVVFQHCGGGFVQPTAWEHQVVDLTPYAGGPATIEFHMMASTVVNHAGWYIDDVIIQNTLEASKTAPAIAEPGEVISYSIVITAPTLVDGMSLTDTLPAGVAYAGNLSWSDGNAWYDEGSNTVRWEYHLPQVKNAPAPPQVTIDDPASTIDLAAGVEPMGIPPAGPLATWVYPEAVLWDNGPLVTFPGACGGMDASRLQTSLGMSAIGFGNQLIYNNHLADDFTITSALGWQIDTVTFFAYQTNAPVDPTPFTGVYYQIWDGPPDDPGSSIVWGDLSTNRLITSTFTNIQRDADSNNCTNTRFIFANVASAGLTLPPGTYWLDWITDGSASYTGPWAPPITILGQTTTGNALQYLGSSSTWHPALDTSTGTQQGMPFIVEGVMQEPVQVEVTFDITVTAACGDMIINEGIVGNGANFVPFAAVTQVTGDCDIAVTPLALEATLLADTSTTQSLKICNLGKCPLDWQIYETAQNQASKPVLVIQDQYPWGLDSIQQVLNASGILYDQVDSAQIPLVDLAPYDLVIIPSNQPDSYYTTWNANLVKFESYVAGGGALWLSTCAYPSISPEPLLPGGVINSTDLDNYNDIIAPSHPWVAGVPNPMWGNYASHDSFTNLYPGSLVIAQAQTSHNPTLVDYMLGDGRILITGQTLEITWEENWDGAAILENSLLDMYLWAYTADIPWLSEEPITDTLPAGDCQTATVTLDASGLALGDYFADLLILNNDPDTPQVTLPVTLTVYQTIDLSVDKTATPDPVYVGEALAYTITVSNHGPANATTVILTDILPAVTFEQATPSQGACTESGGVVTCELGDLAVGDSATILIEVNAPMTEVTLTNTVEVDATEIDSDPTNNVASVDVEVSRYKNYLPITRK